MSKKGPDLMHLDPSVIYRCVNPITYLKHCGYRTCLAHVDKIPSSFSPDVVIFHRPRFDGKNGKFQKAFDKYKDAVRIADYDDLLFDLDLMDSHPGLISGRMSKKILAAETEQYEKALNFFKIFTVSTLPLKLAIESILKKSKIILVPNGLDPRWVDVGGVFKGKEQSQTPSEEKKIISYFAGTSNHDKDLTEVTSQLVKFTDQNADYDVHVYGSINPKDLGVNSSQWFAVSNVPFFLLPKRIQQSWVSIAPLKSTPFNACKSGLKFFESGVFGVPVVASPLPDFKRFENDGLKIVNSAKDWYGELDQLRNEAEWKLASEQSQQAAIDWDLDGCCQDLERELTALTNQHSENNVSVFPTKAINLTINEKPNSLLGSTLDSLSDLEKLVALSIYKATKKEDWSLVGYLPYRQWVVYLQAKILGPHWQTILEQNGEREEFHTFQLSDINEWQWIGEKRRFVPSDLNSKSKIQLLAWLDKPLLVKVQSEYDADCLNHISRLFADGPSEEVFIDLFESHSLQTPKKAKKWSRLWLKYCRDRDLFLDDIKNPIAKTIVNWIHLRF